MTFQEGKTKESCQKEPQDFQNVTREGAEDKVRSAIYQAALIFERLEDAGKISGNGHHIAQDISNYAVEFLKKRWI